MSTPSIPSNLIPISITRLPLAPVPFPQGTVPIVVNGSLYQVDLAIALGQVAVTASRNINTSYPLQGGGNLQLDRTISLALSSLTPEYLADVVIGSTMGGLRAIPVITINSKGQVTSLTTVPIDLDQYALKLITFSPSDASLIGGGDLSQNRVIRINYNDLSPPQPTVGNGLTGTSVNPARSDHQHPAVDLSNTEVKNILPANKGGTGLSLTSQTQGISYWGGQLGTYAVIPNPQTPLPGNQSVGVLRATVQSNGSVGYDWNPATGEGTIISVTVRQETGAGQPNPPLFTAPTSNIPNADVVVSWANQSSNQFLASPATVGTSGVPSYRSIEVEDLPNSLNTMPPYVPFGSTNQSAIVTADNKGRVIALSSISIGIAAPQVTSLGAGWNPTVAVPWTTNVNISGGRIIGTPIGTGGANTGNFTSLSSMNISVGGMANTILSTSLGDNDTGRAPSVYANVLDTNTATIRGGNVDGTPIGVTTAASGRFTSLRVSEPGTLTIESFGPGRRPVYAIDDALTDADDALGVDIGGTGLESPTGYLRFRGLAGTPTPVTAIPNADLAFSTINIGTTPPIPLGESGSDHNYLQGLTRVTVTQAPINPNDLATKAYVDNVGVLGIHVLMPVRTATTGNITLSGSQTIDGVAVVPGDRVLVKNQTSSPENGVYVVQQVGPWSRADDAGGTINWDLLVNAYVFVIITGIAGQTQGGSGWLCNVERGGTFGVTPITFPQFSGGAGYSAGTGLTLTGSQFSITSTGIGAGSYGNASNVASFTVNAQGQLTQATSVPIAIDASAVVSGTLSSAHITGDYSAITGVGTITTGTWNGMPVTVAYGGTGATTLTGYVRGSGTNSLTASPTIPNTDITGLGTMSVQNANAVMVTGGSINNTPIGATTPNTGMFSGLTVSGAGTTVTLNPSLGSTINNVAIGATTPSSGRFTNLLLSGVNTGVTLSPTNASSINNVAIGATTPSTGNFTALTTASASVNGVTTINTTATQVAVNVSGNSDGYSLDTVSAVPNVGFNNGQAIRVGRLDFLSTGKTLNPTPTAGQIEFNSGKLYFTTTADTKVTRYDITTFDAPGSALAYSFILS